MPLSKCTCKNSQLVGKKKNQRKQSSRMIIKIFQNVQINYQQDDKKLSSYPTRDLLVLNKELLHHD